MLRELPEGSSIRKDLFLVSFLPYNAFIWLYVVQIMIDRILSDLQVQYAQNIIIWLIFYTSILGSLIFGSFLLNVMSRLKFLYLWVLLGVVSSSIAMFSCFTGMHVLLTILSGVSFGLGIPSCFAYLADYTSIENRGRVSGIIFLVTNLSAPPLVILSRMFDLVTISIILTIWRASSLIIFFLKPPEMIVPETKRDIFFTSSLKDKSFILYLTAWLMFNFIDGFEKPILDYIFKDFFYVMVAPIVGSFFALIGGILCDRVGRKRVVIYGFVSIGIAYAIIGIAPATLFSWYFFVTIESISWGIFFVTFILVLWGDLSRSGTREEYYAIGGAPFFLSDIVRLLSASLVTLIPMTSAFSLASFFLFLAVLPLLYAPETLPEKKIELRKLRKYVEKAKGVQQEYAEKPL